MDFLHFYIPRYIFISIIFSHVFRKSKTWWIIDNINIFFFFYNQVIKMVIFHFIFVNKGETPENACFHSLLCQYLLYFCFLSCTWFSSLKLWPSSSFIEAEHGFVLRCCHHVDVLLYTCKKLKERRCSEHQYINISSTNSSTKHKTYV